MEFDEFEFLRWVSGVGHDLVDHYDSVCLGRGDLHREESRCNEMVSDFHLLNGKWLEEESSVAGNFDEREGVRQVPQLWYKREADGDRVSLNKNKEVSLRPGSLALSSRHD